ncbi:AI-2E family transporter [Palleronia sediminis]|uniref:AI-2E family transporter n=1 Tax=Palleronia sediminis TaxID=2547833 RepID=A0A4R6AI57_9RHOB|nr:AI-2E family transporter [Palleronia sediminis]TDL83620.1 AI-2E family transporter [Palleronia sediminis]
MSTASDRLETSARIATIVMGVILLVGAMSLAQSVFAPTLLALVIGIVLSPVSDLLERIGLPGYIAALASFFLALLLIFTLAALLLPVVQKTVDAWPAIMGELRAFLLRWQSVLQGLESAQERINDVLSPEGNGNGDTEGGGMAMPGTADALFLAPAVAGQTITFAGVLFFFLLTRRRIYGWCAQHISAKGAETELARRLLNAERRVARYFVTITVVNLGFGLAVTAAMIAVGMPNPYIWGAATTLMNFVLYLGPALLWVALLLAGLVVFDGAYSLVPALVYICLNMIEAQFVTPTAIGRSLAVNPLVVFLSLVFFLWLWGPIGGFIAIPLVLWILTLAKEFGGVQREIREELDRARTAPAAEEAS